MGVMAREQGELFVITSDRIVGDSPSKTAPKKQNNDFFKVWTGVQWSANMADAKTFEAIEQADEYIRENSSQIMEHG